MISQVLENIKTALEAEFTDMSEIDLHDGRFNLEEAQQFLSVAPALRIATLGATKVAAVGNGQYDPAWDVAVFITTKDEGHTSKLLSALDMAEKIAELAAENNWGVANAHPATQLKVTNLYSGPVADAGLALWAVHWKQPVRIGTDMWAEEGTVPDKVYAGHEPKTGAAHKDDYVQVTGEGS